MRHLHVRVLAIGIVIAVLAGCARSSSPWPGGLELEEHPLAAAPIPESLRAVRKRFLPVMPMTGPRASPARSTPLMGTRQCRRSVRLAI
jgi:hypothetical protein